MTRDYPSDWSAKYTNPELRARLKDAVVAGDKGGQPGQWSARKAQLLKAEFERAGGGYHGKKDETQQHLSQWSAEEWQTSDGGTDARTGSAEEKGGASRRYLPKQAWDALSEEEKRATAARKADGSADGEQYVANPPAAAAAGRAARRHDDLPVAGYDELSAKEAAKAVGGLDQADQVRAVAAYERSHAERKTVLDRAARRLSQL
jgi:hypothetical protein